MKAGIPFTQSNIDPFKKPAAQATGPGKRFYVFLLDNNARP